MASIDDVKSAFERSAVAVLIGKNHVQTPSDLVNTVLAIHKAGMIPEMTLRIDEKLLLEATAQLADYHNEGLIYGIGSILNPEELELALRMKPDFVVSPNDGVGGYLGSRYINEHFVDRSHDKDVFCIPAAQTPTEIGYWLEREKYVPDAIKIFSIRALGMADGLRGILEPFDRDRHAGKMLMLSGGTSLKTAVDFYNAAAHSRFLPILSVTEPLQNLAKDKKIGDVEALKQYVNKFKEDYLTLGLPR